MENNANGRKVLSAGRGAKRPPQPEAQILPAGLIDYIGAINRLTSSVDPTDTVERDHKCSKNF
jgi:hypothetical protein